MAISRNDQLGMSGTNLAGGLASLLLGNNSTNPAKSANKYLDKIYGQINPMLQPYANAGTNVLGNFNSQLMEMLKNPGDIIKRLGSGYQESPGYKWDLKQGEEAINNAAASSGMLGTPQHQVQSSQLASNLASKDFDTYLNHILGLFGGGLQGEQGEISQGYNASNDLAQALSSILGTKAQYAYGGQAAKNAGKTNAFESIGSGLGELFGPAIGALGTFFGL
jgi:hypothetical protein